MVKSEELKSLCRKLLTSNISRFTPYWLLQQFLVNGDTASGT